MREFTVGRHPATLIPECKGVPALTLLDEIEESRSSSARLYRTYVHIDKMEYEFTTTSKDVQLDMGRLSQRGQQALATLVNSEATDSSCQLLIKFSRGEEGNSKALLFTIARERNRASITMAPAR